MEKITSDICRLLCIARILPVCVYVFTAHAVHARFLYIEECTCACTDSGTNQTGGSCFSRCAPKRTTLFDTSRGLESSLQPAISRIKTNTRMVWPSAPREQLHSIFHLEYEINSSNRIRNNVPIARMDRNRKQQQQ